MSPDEAAFLKAIGDNPADETARLVYADWLSDHDDLRTTFARLSAEFLRCIRDLADTRRALPTEWLELMDPLFNRFCLIRVPDLGSSIAQAVITELFVVPGGSMLKGQAIFNLTTESRAQRQLRAEESGFVTAVLVRPGETVATYQPLFAYISGLEKFVLRTPRAPMLAFIHSLESQRKTLRQNPRELNEAMLARHATATDMVFGTKAVQEAVRAAERLRGWDTSSHSLTTRMKEAGFTPDQMVQERIDVHIEMLRRLLVQHGQPDGFRELSSDFPPATE